MPAIPTQAPRRGQLRVWYNSNLGHPPFTRHVDNTGQAIALLELLVDYDRYLRDRVQTSAHGLEIYEPGPGEQHPDGWVEWDDPINGEDICQMMLRAKQPANKRRAK